MCVGSMRLRTKNDRIYFIFMHVLTYQFCCILRLVTVLFPPSFMLPVLHALLYREYSCVERLEYNTRLSTNLSAAKRAEVTARAM